MTLFHTRKEKLPVAGICSVLLLLLLLLGLSVGMDKLAVSNDAKQAELLENALNRSITSCYALEGAYPPDLLYLTSHYGLVYDEEQYFIDYQYIGANLRPDVTIIKRNP